MSLPIGRATILVLLALGVGLNPAFGLAQAALAVSTPQAETGPNAADPRFDGDDRPEAGAPSIDDAGPLAQASSQETQAYDEHVRAAFAAAQNLKGPLEGAWRVVDGQGHTALRLELSDPRDGNISGAWFDPTAVDAKAGAGMIDDALRQGQGFIAHLLPQGSLDLTTLQVQPASDGSWTGTLLRGARTTAVVMNRDPASLSAFTAAGASVSPYNPAAARPAAKAPAKKKAVRKAPAKKPAAKASAKVPVKKK